MKRRTFVKKAATGASVAGLGISTGCANAAVATMVSPSPKEKLRVAVMGLNGRGRGLISSFGKVENTEITYLCDVDSRTFARAAEGLSEVQESTAKTANDFRTILDDPDVDAMVFAIPDFWQTPAALMSLQAGKHVYLEKPGSHNPEEGKLLIEAEKKYGKVLTLGTQQRSDPRSIEAIKMIRDGLIGEVYMGKAFYSNTRGSIGVGKKAAVPSELDYELWQGPAPRREYQDNLVHYNWHWFETYGTGESCNNATHEVDVCRWALGVDYPTRVVSSGGRSHFDDDWEFYDNQIMSFEFEGEKTISWEGRSCSGFRFFDRGRGSTIHGTKGTLLIDRDGYIFYDLDNKEIARNMKGEQTDQLNTIGGGDLTDFHATNFADAIRDGVSLNQTMESGQKSVLLCHLGNIAQSCGEALHCDPSTGEIKQNAEAQAMWGREYEPGWEPKI